MRALINKKTLEVLDCFEDPNEVPAQINPDLVYVIVPDDDYEALKLDYAWKRLRKNRNRLLAMTDFTQISDCSLSMQEKNDWATYRQTLRDLPQQVTNPMEVEYPLPPSDPVLDDVNELLEVLNYEEEEPPPPPEL